MNKMPIECNGCPLIEVDEEGVEWCRDRESQDSGVFVCWGSKVKK